MARGEHLRYWGCSSEDIPLLGACMPLDLATAEDDILEAIDLIRPALQSDGGDIVYQGVDPDGVVHVSLVGACGTCPVSMMTLKAGVERIIMDRVPGVTEVVADEQPGPVPGSASGVLIAAPTSGPRSPVPVRETIRACGSTPGLA